MRLQIVKLKRSKLRNDDGTWSRRSSIEIQAIAVQNFWHLLCRTVIGKQAHRSVAVGEKVDSVSDPHGMMIIRVVPRDFDYAGVVQTVNPDRTGLATAVTFPCLLPLGMRNIRKVGAIWGKRSVLRDRQWQRCGEPSFHWNRVQLILKMDEVAAPGVEHHLLAIRRPSCDVFVSRVVRQSSRHATGGGHHEHVSVTVILSRECDHGSIRREMRQHFDSNS